MYGILLIETTRRKRSMDELGYSMQVLAGFFWEASKPNHG